MPREDGWNGSTDMQTEVDARAHSKGSEGMEQNGRLEKAVEEVKDLHQKILGRPAPSIELTGYLPLPQGVDPADHAMRELDQLRWLAEQLQYAPQPATWYPQADCYATQDGLVLRVEISDVDRDALKILVHDGECIVRGVRKQPTPTSEMRPVTLERPWGPFERRIPLPAGCDSDTIKAKVHDGMLELRVAVAPGKPFKKARVVAA